MLESQSIDRVESTSNSDDSLFNMIARSPLNRFKVDVLVELCKILVYLAVSVFIFSIFYRSASFKFLEERYYSSDELFYNKTIRGMFPSLAGKTDNLLGSWNFTYLSTNLKPEYLNYSITFSTNHLLRIRRNDCEGNVAMKWVAFDHNINIWEWKEDEKDMEISPENEDITCIVGESDFVKLLSQVCIWTIEEEKLSLLIEEEKGNSMRVVMLGFEHK